MVAMTFSSTPYMSRLIIFGMPQKPPPLIGKARGDGADFIVGEKTISKAPTCLSGGQYPARQKPTTRLFFKLPCWLSSSGVRLLELFGSWGGLASSVLNIDTKPSTLYADQKSFAHPTATSFKEVAGLARTLSAKRAI